MVLGCVNPEGKSLISSAWSENLECYVQWGQLWSQAEFWGLCFSTWWQEISQNRWVQREKMSLFCSCITCLCQFKWPPGLCKIFWTLRGWKGIRNYFLPSLRFPLIQLSWSGQVYCRDVLQSPLSSWSQEPPDTKKMCLKKVTLVRKSEFGRSGTPLSCWSPTPAGSPRSVWGFVFVSTGMQQFWFHLNLSNLSPVVWSLSSLLWDFLFYILAVFGTAGDLRLLLSLTLEFLIGDKWIDLENRLNLLS